MDDPGPQEPHGKTPILWWVAGADADILAGCPRGDQIFVQHLGISLIAAFLFVFSISAISIQIAFPDLRGRLDGFALAIIFAGLIAAMVFLIDRLFIQYDWDWQAAKQKRELAEAAWEKAPAEERIVAQALETNWDRFFAKLKRGTVILSRVTLSAAIGLTIASFLELVIYKDEIATTIMNLHYKENQQIYDEIKSFTVQLDEELGKAKAERDRLLQEKAASDSELNRLELAPPPLPSDKAVADIDAQIADLRTKVAQEEANIKRYNEDMIAEFRGTQLNPWNSGIQGPGPKYQTALDLKSLSEAAMARYNTKIASLGVDKQRATSNRDCEYDSARKRVDERKIAVRSHLNEVAASLATAQSHLLELENGRESSIESFTSALKNKPSFIPISYGVAGQFRALRTLYDSYGSTFEMYMIKLLIMMLEMTPVLQKVLLSPATLYAVRLDAKRRSEAYGHFDEELRLRQDHLRRKADAALDEELDGKGIERVRKSNVTPLHEGKGGM